MSMPKLPKLVGWRLGDILGAPWRGVLRFIAPATLSPDERDNPFSPDWLFGLLLYETIAVGLTCVLPVGSFKEMCFWIGLPAMFLPLAMRIGAPRVARAERVLLLAGLAVSTFLVKFLVWPTGISQFDEFLHWVTATNILVGHRLFMPNPILPVSPLYPGLEILTTALVNLTGLPLFIAAMLVVVVARVIFISALFAMFERLAGSARLAGIACLAYMGGSGYLLFDSQFAYETLALALMAFALFLETELAATKARTWVTLGLLMPVLWALIITHHITSYAALLLLAGFAILQLLRRPRERVLPLVLVTVIAVVSAVTWSRLIGNPMSSYLGPTLLASLSEVTSLVQSHSAERQYFVNSDGTTTPLLVQLPGFLAVALTAILLANGFFTSLARASRWGDGWRGVLDLIRLHWNSRPFLLTLLALCWPISYVLRLTVDGWEVGNRMAAVAFFGVGFVIACSIARLWRRPGQWVAGASGSLLLTLIIFGGVITGWGHPAVHRVYKVEGDALSIEPMSIDAAEWTRTWLSDGNRFVADRDNNNLLATYGMQHILGGSYDDLEVSNLFVSNIASDYEIGQIRRFRVDYLLVDMRLTDGLPFFGNYFDQGEPPTVHSQPLNPKALLKWDHVPGVSRVFDNGWIVIYDVRALQHAT